MGIDVNWEIRTQESTVFRGEIVQDIVISYSRCATDKYFQWGILEYMFDIQVHRDITPFQKENIQQLFLAFKKAETILSTATNPEKQYHALLEMGFSKSFLLKNGLIAQQQSLETEIETLEEILSLIDAFDLEHTPCEVVLYAD